MTRLRRLWARFFELSPSEQRVVLSAAILMPVFWVGLRVLGLSRLHSLIERRTANQRVDLDDVHRLGSLVNIAARYSVGPRTCLTRSMLLVWLLRRRGIDCQLRIGVRRTNGVLDAHAWVEHAGFPVNDQPDVGARFASFGDLVPLEAFDAP